MFRAVIAIATILTAGCIVPDNPWTGDVLRVSNSARSSGHTCLAYPSIPRFSQVRDYPPGAAQLIVDPKLRSSAQNHADYMALTGDYRHQSIEDIGAAGGRSENIAYIGPITATTPEGVVSTQPEADSEVGQRLVDAWLQSPGHCHNLMQPQWRRIGVGVALSPRSGIHYGVQVFGR